MKILIQGGKEINLSKKDFLSSGGEGDVYVKGGDAYKIYTNGKSMPLGKIQELSVINNPNIIAPKKILYTPKKDPIGYSMRFVSDTYALVQLFTKAFRERNALDHDTMQSLVKQLRGLVADVHKHEILIVDLNEMNYLVSKNFKDIFGIDTDSYQTKSYPATAIMDSIRDRHTSTFSKGTDWFSFAVISFQMFIGIHPYKGGHAIKKLDERMLKNISVFNSSVKLPKVCYPFDVIPESYKDWYKAVFEDGKRVAPPESFDNFKVDLRIQKINGTNNFNITELFTYDGNIIQIHTSGANRVLTDKRFYYTDTISFSVGGSPKIAITPKKEAPLLCGIVNRKLKVIHGETKEELKCSIGCTGMMVSNGNLYLKLGEGISLAEFVELPNGSIIVSATPVANVLEHGCALFDGVAVQNLLGAMMFSVFPKAKQHQQIRIKELDGYRVLDAKYDNLVLMAEVLKDNKYSRATIRFDKSWNGQYDIDMTEPDISMKPINFVCLEQGIVVSIYDGVVHVYSNKMGSKDKTEINDPVIDDSVTLHKSYSKAMFSRGNKLYSIAMKR